MQVTAWNNGQYYKSGAGYGLKITVSDRDRLFRKDWKTVFLTLPDTDEEAEVNIAKSSFWNGSCRELISAGIGRWMLLNGYAPWPAGQPPKFELESVGGNRFGLRKI
jgi:hypothetical protein